MRTLLRKPSLRSFALRTSTRPATARRLTTLTSSQSQQLDLIPAPKFSDLSAAQQQRIEKYLDILEEWNNTKMNLTAIKTREEAYERHVNDSLTLLPVIDSYCFGTSDIEAQLQQQQAQKLDFRVIDVGSGAGLPGFMLAVARPHWRVTLLDSLQKRCKFMEEVIAVTGIDNVDVVCDRAELAGHDPLLRGGHQVVVARAVAELRVLAELCLPLVAKGGYWVAAKGANPQEEVGNASHAIEVLGGELRGVHEVDSMAPDGRRTAVVVQKTGKTRSNYPRQPGTPKKDPL